MDKKGSRKGIRFEFYRVNKCILQSDGGNILIKKPNKIPSYIFEMQTQNDCNNFHRFFTARKKIISRSATSLVI